MDIKSKMLLFIYSELLALCCALSSQYILYSAFSSPVLFFPSLLFPRFECSLLSLIFSDLLLCTT